MSYHYVWLAWSSAFLMPWVLLYAQFPQQRVAMLWTSGFMALFGLTEPIFVPEYWNPPSLFELAQRTGFDIESVIFSFAIGGVGAVLYDILAGKRLEDYDPKERHGRRHGWHRLALAVPFASFPFLYFLPWNPIYPGIFALVVAAAAAILCRPDLFAKTLLGGAIFVVYYAVFMLALSVFAPGYIAQVWNLPALSGVLVRGIPLEELLFGFAFGMYWTGVYEHLTWRGTPVRTRRLRSTNGTADQRART